MKKKIFGSIAVLAIAVMAAWNVNLSKQNNDLSSISLANVEALANGSGEANGSNKYFVISYTTNEEYTDGNGCTVLKTTYHTNCMSGGSSDCTPGSYTSTTKVCPPPNN